MTEIKYADFKGTRIPFYWNQRATFIFGDLMGIVYVNDIQSAMSGMVDDIDPSKSGEVSVKMKSVETLIKMCYSAHVVGASKAKQSPLDLDFFYDAMNDEKFGEIVEVVMECINQSVPTEDSSVKKK